MIKNHLEVKREYTQDYDVLVKETSEKTIKLFGLVLYKTSSDLIHENVNKEQTRRPIGLRQHKNEESD